MTRTRSWADSCASRVRSTRRVQPRWPVVPRTVSRESPYPTVGDLVPRQNGAATSVGDGERVGVDVGHPPQPVVAHDGSQREPEGDPHEKEAEDQEEVGIRARAQAKSWKAPAMAANEAITR